MPNKMGRFAYSTTVKWWSSSSVFRLLVFHIIILYVSYIFLLKETLALQTETVHTYIQTEDRQGSPDVDKQSSTVTIGTYRQNRDAPVSKGEDADVGTLKMQKNTLLDP